MEGGAGRDEGEAEGIGDETFLRQDGFDADGIAFREEQLNHLCVLRLQGCILVMDDVPEIFGECIGGNRDQTCCAGFHQFAGYAVVAAYNEKLLLTFDF